MQIGWDIFFMKFDQNLVEFMTSSLDQFAYFKILNISGTKGDLWNSKQGFSSRTVYFFVF